MSQSIVLASMNDDGDNDNDSNVSSDHDSRNANDNDNTSNDDDNNCNSMFLILPTSWIWNFERNILHVQSVIDVSKSDGTTGTTH